jgi:hypothetical protein
MPGFPEKHVQPLNVTFPPKKAKDRHRDRTHNYNCRQIIHKKALFQTAVSARRAPFSYMPGRCGLAPTSRSPGWRRGRDSNPRWLLRQSGFQDRRDRPLCHLSRLRLGAASWHGRRESNPQPTVLETATLPIELLPYPTNFSPNLSDKKGDGEFISASRFKSPTYFITSLTRPAPIVRPPSRIAKRWPFSIATGAISSISTETLSPGMTISTPCGSVTVPVTSDVRK